MEKSELPELMTTRQVAGWLGLTERTVRDWAWGEKIPALNLSGEWRFSRAALRRWLDERGVVE